MSLSTNTWVFLTTHLASWLPVRKKNPLCALTIFKNDLFLQLDAQAARRCQRPTKRKNFLVKGQSEACTLPEKAPMVQWKGGVISVG